MNTLLDSQQTRGLAAVASSDWFGEDDLLSVSNVSRVKLYLLVDTGEFVMEQIELDISRETLATLQRARHLSVDISIWEGVDTKPTLDGSLLFPKGMQRPVAPCTVSGQPAEREEGASREQ